MPAVVRETAACPSATEQRVEKQSDGSSGGDFAWREKVMNRDVDIEGRRGAERRIPGDRKQTLTKLGNQGLNE